MGRLAQPYRFVQDLLCLGKVSAAEMGPAQIGESLPVHLPGMLLSSFFFDHGAKHERSVFIVRSLEREFAERHPCRSKRVRELMLLAERDCSVKTLGCLRPAAHGGESPANVV